MLPKRNIVIVVAVLAAVAFFFGGYYVHKAASRSSSTAKVTQQEKSFYISFDDYYYEAPKGKAVDDKLVVGGQFLYNFNTGIKTNTLDDLFNNGAIAVQALIPLNGDTEAFERYINEAVKPAAIEAFKGTADVSFGNRKEDNARTAEVVVKKDGVVVRRQFIVNMAQSVNVIARDDSEAYHKIADTLGRASAKFSDYETMKLLVLSHSFMLSNRMFDDMYRLSHEDLRAATSVDELNRFADKSKEIFNLGAEVSGVTLNKNEMNATVHYTDSKNPANSRVAVLQFRQADGVWKLLALQLPGGLITGAPAAAPAPIQ